MPLNCSASECLVRFQHLDTALEMKRIRRFTSFPLLPALCEFPSALAQRGRAREARTLLAFHSSGAPLLFLSACRWQGAEGAP